MANDTPENEPVPRETKEWGAAELLEIAAKMEHFGKRYRELAAQLAKSETLTVGNIKTLRTSLQHIKRAVNVAYEAFDDRLLANGALADDDTPTTPPGFKPPPAETGKPLKGQEDVPRGARGKSK